MVAVLPRKSTPPPPDSGDHIPLPRDAAEYAEAEVDEQDEADEDEADDAEARSSCPD